MRILTMHLCVFILLALIQAIAPSDCAAQEQPDEFFLTCDPDSFQYIYDNYWNDIYISCTLTYQGQTWPWCRVRIRGDSTRPLPKKSLKVKTDGELFWHGRDTVNFNADYVDRSYLHSVLCSRLFREAGVPCFAATHARLHLNGSYFGLYINVENMDEDFIESWGFGPNGNLYKATRDGACLSIWDDVPNVWEKKTNESASWDDLYLLIDQINNVPGEYYHDWAQSALDYEEIISAIAMNILVSNGSTYYHNYYVFHDVDGGGEWLWMPWDVDKSFGYYEMLPYFRSGGWIMPDNPLLERLLLCEPMVDDLWNRVHVLADSLYNLAYLDPIIDSLIVVLESSVLEDHTDQISSVESWLTQIEHERLEGVQRRIGDLDLMYDTWPHSFLVDRLPYSFPDSVTVTWHPAEDLEGDNIYYRVKYTTDIFWPQDETWSYYGITDTTFTLPVALPDGEYFYEVAAYDGDQYVPGYDVLSRFYVDAYTELPPVISEDYILSYNGSPYYVAGELIIESGATVSVSQGVQIRFAQDASILVQGAMHFNGSESLPIHLMPDLAAESWDCVAFDQSSFPSSFRHVIVEKAAGAAAEPWRKAAISILDTDVSMEHMLFRDNARCIYSEFGDLNLSDSEFEAGNEGEVVTVRYANAITSHCVFHDVSGGDAVGYAGSPEGLVRDCEFHGGTDNAVDIGEESVATVERNFITGFEGKGVSLSGKSTGDILYNVVAHCGTGVAVTDSAAATLGNNSFYADSIAMACFEDSAGAGGGEAAASNSILASSIDADQLVDPWSSLEISWTLSDTGELPGEGNLMADPQFAAPGELDFRILRSSPCLDAGDPESPPDPDGSRADMGAIPYNLGAEIL